jgi:hypothetical protein
VDILRSGRVVLGLKELFCDTSLENITVPGQK